MKKRFFLILLGTALVATAAPKKLSPVISTGADGRLVYDADEHGNRVPDFSSCGYMGGDQPIPDAPVRIVVAPASGDETARIQKAIDYVASLPPDTNGVRGAVLLLKGRHEVWGGLSITNSGVVLRGQGMDENGTLLVAAGQGRRTLIRIAGRDDLTVCTNAGWQIADDYVPVGATSFHVKDAGSLKTGGPIRLIRPSTQAWIDRLGMTEFGGGEGDWRLTWKPGSRDVIWDRVVKSIDGNLVTVDAPVTTAMEREFGGGRVETYSWPGRISQVGIENLRMESAFDAGNPRDENHSWLAITMENVQNAWVRQVTATHFAGSLVAIYESCKWVTVQDCLSFAPVSEEAGYRRNTFFTMGQMTLFLRCWAEHGRHDFSVGHCAAGPNTFVQCEASQPLGDSGPMESWAGGVLYDNVRIDGNGLSLANRGSTGEGAGWSAANSVLWQCSASLVRCENPPTAQNWAFGCWGEFEGDGIWRDSNGFVKPVSLYAAQLAGRRGTEMAASLKLMPRPTDDKSNPTIEEAAKLIAASRKPAPQLSDYITEAAKRNPITSEASGTPRVEDIPGTPHVSRLTPHVISITNGWLVCDGRLLTGGILEVNWWQGNMRPGEAPKYGPTLTRFAPGRGGRGYTDDLDELADTMVAKNDAALDYHYGLWYDRRREDHERVRRINGDVWAPFYEQPFARSGQGTAWDGLSQYDLTRFNPWYWGRLKQFADICDERGLVLFNENYFQHNILEAGAHWVDCPWRSVNNINHTGFPEPPPFAGDKRIFMAEQFYDVTNPVRRKLHEDYIRQNLNNFTNDANVIQLTSAEFTGPLAFMQFWLDTIAGWERERVVADVSSAVEPGVPPGGNGGGSPDDVKISDGSNNSGASPGGRMPPSTAGGTPAAISAPRRPLIALAATKDVQDAILADPQRSAVVDVICFRYWWRTDKGLFAPKGGQNLSPRQFERQWKSGTPSDANLAAMAAEYRQRFQGKAVIASGEDVDLSRGSWAFVCAGGSLPNLPRTTDARLLEAIPKMQPWAEVSGTNRWVLRESGRQYLVYSSGEASVGLDLSAESGSFRVNGVNPKTGEVTPGETTKAGSKMKLPNAMVVWLVKE